MMRMLTVYLTVLLCLCSSANVARANCAVIDTVDKLHAVQMRLLRAPTSPLYVSDLRLLRNEIGKTADRQVHDAIGAGPLTAKGATFARFMRNTRALVEQASIDDPSRVQIFYSNPNVRANLRAVGGFLSSLRCTTSQIAADAATARPDSDDSAIEVLRDAADEVLDPTNILIASAVIASGVVMTRVISAWLILRRRRTKRHPAKFETMYMIDDQTRHGVLHDISGYGTKLEHDPDVPLSEKTAIGILIYEDWIPGTVQWSNSHYAGINFKRALKQNIVKEVSKHGTASGIETAQKNGAPAGRRSETVV